MWSPDSRSAELGEAEKGRARSCPPVEEAAEEVEVSGVGVGALGEE